MITVDLEAAGRTAGSDGPVLDDNGREQSSNLGIGDCCAVATGEFIISPGVAICN